MQDLCGGLCGEALIIACVEVQRAQLFVIGVDEDLILSNGIGRGRILGRDARNAVEGDALACGDEETAGGIDEDHAKRLIGTAGVDDHHIVGLTILRNEGVQGLFVAWVAIDQPLCLFIALIEK